MWLSLLHAAAAAAVSDDIGGEMDGPKPRASQETPLTVCNVLPLRVATNPQMSNSVLVQLHRRRLTLGHRLRWTKVTMAITERKPPPPLSAYVTCGTWNLRPCFAVPMLAAPSATLLPWCAAPMVRCSHGALLPWCAASLVRCAHASWRDLPDLMQLQLSVSCASSPAASACTGSSTRRGCACRSTGL